MNSAKIELLPEHLIDQIKAGEVIERPANVLKELMENALDAGAQQIDVEIKDNGLSLLRVTDNGQGILSDQLQLAFGRHATSKIRSFQDLYRLGTFGFRGEALPSIASISQLECVSWTKDNPTGGLIRIDGGQLIGTHSAAKSAMDHGTVMTVKDLFFNTPVRLKFLQSATSEKNWLKKFFYSFVLSNPNVGFSIQWDDNERLIYSKVDSIEERIKQLFAHKAQSKVKIYQSHKDWNGIDCRVFNIFSNSARSDGPLQHTIINSRSILDKSYQRVTSQVFEKQNITENHETLILLKVPGDVVDVNVHPNKTVVKIFHSNDLLSLVSSAIREALPEKKREESHLTMSLPETSQNNVPSTSSDSMRGRMDVYADHRDMLNVEPQQDSIETNEIIHHEYGPYLFLKTTERVELILIDGKRLLSTWLKYQKSTETIPLLVTHPLKGYELDHSIKKDLSKLGFEIDDLEDLTLIREIPSWAKNLPIRVIIPLCLKMVGMNLKINDFSFHEVSPSKWLSIWEEMQAVEERCFETIIDPKKMFG